MKVLISRWVISSVLLLGIMSAPLSALESAYFAAVRSAPAPVVGGDYYLRHCFMYEKGEHNATNYWRGALVPINTRVNLVSMSGNVMLLRLETTKESIRVENVPGYTKCPLAQLAARMLSPTPIPVDRFDEATARAIATGTMKLGMTKEQVIMARGYPPAHQTASLDQDTWKYWPSRFVVQTVVFANGVLTAGRGIQ